MRLDLPRTKPQFQWLITWIFLSGCHTLWVMMRRVEIIKFYIAIIKFSNEHSTAPLLSSFFTRNLSLLPLVLSNFIIAHSNIILRSKLFLNPQAFEIYEFLLPRIIFTSLYIFIPPRKQFSWCDNWSFYFAWKKKSYSNIEQLLTFMEKRTTTIMMMTDPKP